MYIPDYNEKKGPGSYLVAMDFADWLTRTRCLSIHGGFDGNGKKDNIHTWALIRLIVARYEDIEHVQLAREGCLHLVHILQWLNFPKLKKLDIHGISEWKHGNVELELEVCM